MVEIIPKPAQKLSSWQNILFYFSFAFFLAAILSYFILFRLTAKSESSLKELEKTLARGKTSQEINLEKEVLTYQRKINDFDQLISRHSYPSGFPPFLENITHPKVWFSQINLDFSQGKAMLSGQTESFITLWQQIAILEKEPKVKNFTLSSFSIGEKGKVDFALNVLFDPAIIKK